MIQASKKSILVLALCLFACGPYKVSQNTQPLQESEKIVVMDMVLKNLNLVKTSSTVDANGRMTVHVEMENEKNKDIWTDIQVIFRDANGTEMERSSWEPVMFNRRSVSSYEKMALKEGAKDYRILIRNTK